MREKKEFVGGKSKSLFIQENHKTEAAARTGQEVDPSRRSYFFCFSFALGRHQA